MEYIITDEGLDFLLRKVESRHTIKKTSIKHILTKEELRLLKQGRALVIRGESAHKIKLYLEK